MKKINFAVTDFLHQQIAQAMERLGIQSKSEFFRVLALNCIKENGITSLSFAADKSEPKPEEELLTPDEEMILGHLKKEAKSVDMLIPITNFSVPELCSLITMLQIKHRIKPIGNRWYAV